MRDYYSNISTAQALTPAVQSATVNGATVDLKDTTRAVFVLNTGAIVSSGDFSAKLQDSADGSAWADVDTDEVDTDAPATLEASSAYRLGYRGFKQYARIVLTKAGGTSIAAGAVAVLDPLDKPVA